MSPPVFEVLVVCTGNIARSPMAQRLLERALGERTAIRVRSAGTWGHEGSAMEPHARTALAEVGVDEGGFRARELTAPMVAQAALVLGATREHRAAVVGLDPSALRRVFTLREFARLLPVVDTAHLAGPTDLVGAVAAARGRVRAAPAEDDVADPFGATLSGYRRCRDVITGAVEVIGPALLAAEAAGSRPADPPGLQ